MINRLFAAWSDRAGGDPVAHRFSGRCSVGHCQRHGEWRCGYTDPTGQRCPTHWCRVHVSFREELAFCRRHAVVAEVMTLARGTIRETKTLPRLEDRGLNLAAMVGADIGPKVLGLLKAAHGSEVAIGGDRAPRAVWRDRVPPAAGEGLVVLGARLLTWEWTWSAFESSGFLSRVLLGVPGSAPASIMVRTDRGVVFDEVPDWVIRACPTGPATADQRASFAGRLTAAIEAGLIPIRRG
jgi:hypothetical protein